MSLALSTKCRGLAHGNFLPRQWKRFFHLRSCFSSSSSQKVLVNTIESRVVVRNNAEKGKVEIVCETRIIILYLNLVTRCFVDSSVSSWTFFAARFSVIFLTFSCLFGSSSCLVPTIFSACYFSSAHLTSSWTF